VESEIKPKPDDMPVMNQTIPDEIEAILNSQWIDVSVLTDHCERFLYFETTCLVPPDLFQIKMHCQRAQGSL